MAENASRPRHYWAFQANPRLYDIEGAVDQLEFDTWMTKRSDVRKGDRALIWKSLGGEATRGIVALAEVTDDPANIGLDTDFWIGEFAPGKELRARIRYVVPENCPLWATADTEPVLRQLTVWGAQGTVFHVAPEQWDQVLELVGGWPEHLEQEVKRQATKLDGEGEFDLGSLPDARKWVLTSIARRQGQPAFRAVMMDAYGSRCAISGCTVEAVLEAAHIHPYRGPDTNHPSNGLLLRADLHTLFDLGLLTVDPDSLEVEIAGSLAASEYALFHGQTLRLPHSAEARPSTSALRHHRSIAKSMTGR